MQPENYHRVPEMDAEHLPDLFAGYVLHALSAEETAAVDAYLAAHPEAMGEIAALEEAAAMLPYSVPPAAPSPRLRLRLMAGVYQDALAEEGERADARRPVALPRARERRGLLWPVAAVILLVLTVGLGGWIAALSGDVRAQQRVIATQQSAIASAGTTAPVVGTAPNAAAKGELLRLASTNAAVLTISGLPPLASGRVYEVWFIAGSAPVAAGVFSPYPDGSWSGLVRGDLSAARAIAISIEPAGGSVAPTGDIVAEGSL